MNQPARPMVAWLAANWFWLWIVAALGYFLAYYSVPMPIQNEQGRHYLRGEFLQLLVVPEAMLVEWVGPDQVLYITDRLPLWGWVLLWTLCAWGLGYGVLWALRIRTLFTRLETHLFSTALGLHGLSLLTLAIGLSGLSAPNWLGRGAVFLGAIAGVLAYPIDRRLVATDTQEQSSTSWVEVAGYFLIFAFLVLMFLTGVLPPSEFDTREYHLQAPKEFYQQGHISFLPHNVYANMPLGAEMHALAAMALTDDWKFGGLAAKGVLPVFVLLSVGGLIALGRRVLNRQAGVLAALLFVSVPWIYKVTAGGYVEGASACYLTFTALAAVIASQQTVSAAHARLLGVTLGAAVSIKYPNLLFLGLPAGIFLLTLPPSSWRQRAWLVAVMLVALAASGGLWFAKNAVFTGNPVYPLLAAWFGDPTRSPELIDRWQEAHAPPNYSPLDLLGRLGQFALTSAWISPVIVPLLCFPWWRQWKQLRVVCLFLGIYLACWWLLTHRIERFWVPALPLVALIGALGWASLSRGWHQTVAFAFVLFGSVGTWFLDGAVGGNYPQQRYFASLNSLWHDPQRLKSAWHLVLNRRCDSKDAVLLVGSADVFDLEPKVYYNTVFNEVLLVEWCEEYTPAECYTLLQEKDIRFVYVDWNWIERYRQPGNYGFAPQVNEKLFRQLQEVQVLAEPLPKPDFIREGFGQVFPLHPTGPTPGNFTQPILPISRRN